MPTLGIALVLMLTTSCATTEDVQETAGINRTLTPSASRSPVTSTSAPPVRSATPFPSITATPSDTPACSQMQGFIEEGSYRSPVLRAEVPYRVYLPACYGITTERHYTLYLLHGFPFDETHWEELGIAEFADDEIASGRWPAFIIIMPLQPDPLFLNTDGGPNSYEVEMVEGLIPAIDQRYRTDPRPAARAVAGISRGGVWALEISFRHPELFDTVAALSPALHVNFARPAYDPFILATKDQPLPANIFLSAGDAEPGFRHATEEFSAVLAVHGVRHEFIIGQGGHDALGWVSVLGDMLDYLLLAWSERS
ncbi:MAG: hypothetical protein GTO14_12475 [Anaerolineales bacterium]|nr:hypothetical protein [Anaerolineales bacterium]